MDLTLNNLQRLICHKPKQTKPKVVLILSIMSEFQPHSIDMDN